MAAQSLVPLYHPSPDYHRDFFLLRMPIKVNNQPSVIKMVDGTPVLHCTVRGGLSVQLVVLAQHVSTVLAEYRITLKGAYYDDNYPLYAIDLPPPISYERTQSLLRAFSNVCLSIGERYFSRVSCKTGVHMQLFLCSPAKDSFTTSKVTSIQLGKESDELDKGFFTRFLDSKIFKFSELFADNFNSSSTIIGLSSTAAAVSIESLLRALSGKASHKWFNLGALLGVSAEKLQRIEKQYRNPDFCLTHTLKNVVDSNTKLTWEEVVSTLSTVGLSNLAEELSKEHGVHFSRAGENVTEPTLQSLSQSLAEVSAKWFFFGALLGVPPSTLQAIDNQYHPDCDDCLTRMLMWLIEESSITWSEVAQAVGQIGYGDLAEQIRQSHDISPVPPENVPQQAEARADDTAQWKIEVQLSVTEIQQDIDTRIQQNYANMKDELKRLKEEKNGIEKRLEQEETQCNSLHESKRLMAIQLKQKDEQHRQKIKTIEKEMIEKESTIADLKRELDRTNMKYNKKSQQMANLTATLTLKTSELVEKSFVLSKIKESLFEDDDALRITDRRMQQQLEAKQVSQAAYLAEIKSQLEAETECVKSLEEECHLVDKHYSDIAAIVASIERDIATKEQAGKTLESDTEVFVEQQIELTELKMHEINRKLELAKAKIKRQDSTQKLTYHRKDFQRAKNLLPELSKCSVDGIDVPVHVARAYVAIEIKVHLHDRDGEPCRGQHLVSLCCETDKHIFTEANSSTPGTYSLSYTPSCLGKRSLVVAVNNEPINETPFKMFFLNTPHLPKCTVEVFNKKIVQHKTFDALVQLKDQNGDPVNSQHNVSAYLKFPDITLDTKANISCSNEYKLALTPPSSGEGVLSIFVDDQPIPSPCVIISKRENMLRVFKDGAFKMLLIGNIGSGKTSFLNLLYNCATVQGLGCGFGAKGLEQFKQFNDIKLENVQALPMESKTEDATLYNVEVGDLKIGVIDTPGFGDSRASAQRIFSALKREEYINCVCLIINGRQSRTSVAMIMNHLSEITAILPKDIVDNMIVVFSNAANRKDLLFDPSLLKEYFGKEVKKICFVENPYCRFEKAKLKVDQLGIDRVAKILREAFEDTSEVLTEMCETIKDFPQVHTHHFSELYEKIEKSVEDSMSVYDNQMRLKKSLNDTKAEVDTAVKSKTLNKDFKIDKVDKHWVVKKTGELNVRCMYEGCRKNCQVPCHLPAKESLKKCACINEEDGLCRVCGHSYMQHCHEASIFKYEEYVTHDIDDDMKDKFEKAKSDEERAKMQYSNLEEELQQSLATGKQLSVKLFKDIAEFETVGGARNYAKLIENQLAEIESHLKGIVGPGESNDLCKTYVELEKRLTVIQAAALGID